MKSLFTEFASKQKLLRMQTVMGNNKKVIHFINETSQLRVICDTQRGRYMKKSYVYFIY